MTDLLSPKDKNSYANNHQVSITHFHLHWTIDFDRQCVRGSVTHSCTRSAPQQTVQHLQLDCRNLAIEGAVLVDEQGQEQRLTYEVLERPQEHAEAFGTPLRIHLPDDTANSFKVRVFYETTAQSEAVQWLKPEQTSGKKYPYLFTQCQAIHARSLFPCFDTPSSKSTYTADVRIPKSLPLVAVMSALRRGRRDLTDKDDVECVVYDFEQPTPIPSYLLAIGVGKLECKKIGPRSHVWAEAEQVDAAAFEFEETEKFIAAAENFLIPYQWGIYDILLLPPSFPFGGMENPCLTTLTPTLLAKDRSLANVVAHEIAHSWSGNLVTNCSWSDFWLNEGFTMYLERRIVARVNGEDQAELQAVLGLNDLRSSVELYEKRNQPMYTALVPKLDNIDPDDAFSTVPYEKGFNFLYYLKNLVGGNDVFEPFLKAYFNHFAHKIIVTEDMKAFFLDYFKDKVPKEKLASIEWDRWFYEPGMPIIVNEFDMTLANAAKELAEKWATDVDSAKTVDISKWSSNQICVFLEDLADKHESLTHSTLDALNEKYQLSKSHNAEITHRWHMLALKLSYTKVYDDVLRFLTSQGRMKFTRPGYRALFAAEGGKDLAVETFKAHRNFYHPICERQVARDLQLN